MKKRKIALTVLTMAVIGSGLFVVTTQAADAATAPNETIIQKLADKFKLNKADVQAVFDQQKQERMANQEKNYETRLDALVKSGKITAAQKTLILNKHKELESTMQANMASMKNLTADQRKAKMQEQKTALETWAKQNGVDVKYLMGMMGIRGHGMGPGMKK